MRVVYTAETSSLANLELLVRLVRPTEHPAHVLLPCYFHEALVEAVDRRRLPKNWRDAPAPPELQEIGNAWLLERTSAVLQVPSAINPNESNFLLSPEHEDFKSIDIGQPSPYKIDFRLLT
jgi:RES domain-containing protein